MSDNRVEPISVDNGYIPALDGKHIEELGNKPRPRKEAIMDAIRWAWKHRHDLFDE